MLAVEKALSDEPNMMYYYITGVVFVSLLCLTNKGIFNNIFAQITCLKKVVPLGTL